jgi:hypothetical protein
MTVSPGETGIRQTRNVTPESIGLVSIKAQADIWTNFGAFVFMSVLPAKGYHLVAFSFNQGAVWLKISIRKFIWNAAIRKLTLPTYFITPYGKIRTALNSKIYERRYPSKKLPAGRVQGYEQWTRFPKPFNSPLKRNREMGRWKRVSAGKA